jgi:hypothetical protein
MYRKIGIAISLCACLITGFMLYKTMQAQAVQMNQEGDAMHNSVGCGNPDATDTRTPCTKEQVTVIKIWKNNQHGNHINNEVVYDYHMVVLDSRGKSHTLNNLFQNFYVSTGAGQIIFANFWRGNIDHVENKFEDSFAIDADSPFQKSQNSFMTHAIAFAVSFMIFMGLIDSYRWFGRRKRVNKPLSPW